MSGAASNEIVNEEHPGGDNNLNLNQDNNLNNVDDAELARIYQDEFLDASSSNLNNTSFRSFRSKDVVSNGDAGRDEVESGSGMLNGLNAGENQNFNQDIFDIDEDARSDVGINGDNMSNNDSEFGFHDSNPAADGGAEDLNFQDVNAAADGGADDLNFQDVNAADNGNIADAGNNHLSQELQDALSTSAQERNENIQTLASILECDNDIAAFLLDKSGGKVDAAIDFGLDGGIQEAENAKRRRLG